VDTELGGAPAPTEIQVPLIALNNVMVRVDTHPSGERMLVMGPMAFAIALTPDLEKWLVDNLKGSGLVIARPDQVPNLSI
jgi:hypothetical protein